MSKLSSSSLRINVSDAERLRKSMACKHSAGDLVVLRDGASYDLRLPAARDVRAACEDGEADEGQAGGRPDIEAVMFVE